MLAMIRHALLTLVILFVIAVVVRVAIPYRQTLLQKEERQLRRQTIKELFNAISASTNEAMTLDSFSTVIGQNGEEIDKTDYIYNTNSLQPGIRKEHRIVLAEKVSRFPKPGLFYAVDEQGTVVAWRLAEYTNLLQNNGISDIH